MAKRDLDWSKLEGMAMFDASLNVCATELDVNHKTIERAIRKTHDMTFAEWKHVQMERTTLRVSQRLIKKALDGDNACMIFYLKCKAGWQETQKIEHSVEKIEIKIDSDDTKL